MVDQLEGVTTDDLLDGYPRVQTWIDIGGTFYLETISVTRPFILNGVSEDCTYVKTFSYGTNGQPADKVSEISGWVKQPPPP